MPISIKSSFVNIKDENGYSPIDAFYTGDVNQWLDDHPEVTTTVQDGSITYAKLSNSLKETILSPDNFTGTDTQKLQAAIDSLHDTGGVIQLSRMYTLTSNIVSTFNTDNVDCIHSFITLVGTANNAGIDFGVYCFDGDNRSVHGGLRFKNLNLMGTADGFVNLNGLIRMRFDNCRIYGFTNLLKDGLIQDIIIQDCHITDVTNAIVYVTTFIYSLRIENNTIEHCGSVIYDDGTHAWQAVYVDYNIIENSTSKQIISGRSASVLSVCKNYFEYITDVIFDLSNLLDSGYNAIGVTFNDNFIMSVNNQQYPFIMLPKSDKYDSTYGDACHGTIMRNSGRGAFIGSEFTVGDNPLRWKVKDNSLDLTYNNAILYDFDDYFTPPTSTITCNGVGVNLSGVLQFLVTIPQFILQNYNITVTKIIIQGVKTITSNISSTSVLNGSLFCKSTDETSLSYVGRGVTVEISTTKKT